MMEWMMFLWSLINSLTYNTNEIMLIYDNVNMNGNRLIRNKTVTADHIDNADENKALEFMICCTSAKLHKNGESISLHNKKIFTILASHCPQIIHIFPYIHYKIM
eukprot:296333_1